MRTIIALTVFFGVLCVCALTQAKPQKNELLKDCSVTALVDVVEAYIENTFELVDNVIKAYETAVEEGLECAKDLDNFSNIVSCVGTTIIDWTNNLMPIIQQYIVNIVTISEGLADDIYSCV